MSSSVAKTQIEQLLSQVDLADKLSVKAALDQMIFQEEYEQKMSKAVALFEGVRIESRDSERATMAQNEEPTCMHEVGFNDKIRDLLKGLYLQPKSLLSVLRKDAPRVCEHALPLEILEDVVEAFRSGKAFVEQRAQESVARALAAAKLATEEDLDTLVAMRALIIEHDWISGEKLQAMREGVASKMISTEVRLEMIKSAETENESAWGGAGEGNAEVFL